MYNDDFNQTSCHHSRNLYVVVVVVVVAAAAAAAAAASSAGLDQKLWIIGNLRNDRVFSGELIQPDPRQASVSIGTGAFDGENSPYKIEGVPPLWPKDSWWTPLKGGWFTWNPSYPTQPHGDTLPPILDYYFFSRGLLLTVAILVPALPVLALRVIFEHLVWWKGRREGRWRRRRRWEGGRRQWGWGDDVGHADSGGLCW